MTDFDAILALLVSLAPGAYRLWRSDDGKPYLTSATIYERDAIAGPVPVTVDSDEWRDGPDPDWVWDLLKRMAATETVSVDWQAAEYLDVGPSVDIGYVPAREEHTDVEEDSAHFVSAHLLTLCARIHELVTAKAVGWVDPKTGQADVKDIVVWLELNDDDRERFLAAY
jgi:hypothetical protein